MMMKNLIYLIVSFVIFFGCSKEDNDSNKLVGKWQLIETRIGDGGSSPEWIEVDENESYYYILNDDTTFSSNKYIECLTGEYIYDESSFSMIYDCEDFTIGVENPPGTFKEIYYFENSNLIITPDYFDCDEGCLYKFKKVPL